METDPSTYKGVIGPLRNRCSHCQASTAKLLRCLGCSAVQYCNREHQAAHWPQHESICVRIKQARAQLAEEEELLRNANDPWDPGNAFETQVGHFWGILGTRDYMRARFALAGDLLINVGSLRSLKEALKHMRDMLRLCRGDNMGVRQMIPAMMLRLDKDQECYDFVKWWATCGSDERYDWGDMNLPYLDTRNADVFERPDFLVTKYHALNYVVAILLLKLKLLVDIRSIRVARKIFAQRSIPPEICALVEHELVRSPLSKRFPKESSEALVKLECKLIRHARELGAALAQANDHFVVNLFEPDASLSTIPQAYSSGSWEEMALAMRYSYAAWWETAGVLDLLRGARACAAADSQDEIDGMMKNETSRTAQELLEDVSINRIWGYLGSAVEDAAFLGPWAGRPSQRHRREYSDDEDVSCDDEAC